MNQENSFGSSPAEVGAFRVVTLFVVAFACAVLLLFEEIGRLSAEGSIPALLAAFAGYIATITLVHLGLDRWRGGRINAVAPRGLIVSTAAAIAYIAGLVLFMLGLYVWQSMQGKEIFEFPLLSLSLGPGPLTNRDVVQMLNGAVSNVVIYIAMWVTLPYLLLLYALRYRADRREIEANHSTEWGDFWTSEEGDYKASDDPALPDAADLKFPGRDAPPPAPPPRSP